MKQSSLAVLILLGACVHGRRDADAPPVFYARVETTKGAFVLEVDRGWAPRGAERFYQLARAGFFDDSRFYRTVPNFIVQFGIARDSAANAPWTNNAILDDSATHTNVRGRIAFATTGPNTRTTQLFISLTDANGRLDAQGFAPIGRVVSGMDVVDALYSATARIPAAACARGSRRRSSTAATPTSTANTRSSTA